MKKKNQTTIASKYWLLIFTMICVLLMGLSFFAEEKDNPLRIVADYTITPMQKGFNQIGTWMRDVSDNFETLQEVKNENKRLQDELDAAQLENRQLQQQSVELERFYELYKMDQNTADYPKVGARVIASEGSNWFTSFVIDKGSNDGIRKDMNVLSGSGLVGIVTNVSPNSATVKSIIDDSNVSAMLLSTFDKCIVSGDVKLMNDGVIRFEQLANNDTEVPVGEQIVTSNISSKYLQGLLIGYVSEVKVDSNNLTRSGHIIPAVDFQKLQEVLVITTTKQDLIDKSESDIAQQ